MTGRLRAARGILPVGRPSRILLVVSALCLITMPQSYRGGAELSHPHAIFQFWNLGDYIAAAHHHGDGNGADHNHDRAGTATRSPAAAESAARAARADTPTISQMTTTAESSDAIGSVLGIWFIVHFAAAAGVFFVRGLGAGLTPSPERPPPRLVTAST